MKKTWIMFIQMIKQISRDLMLVMVCIAPVLAGMFIKLGIPAIEQLLCEHFRRIEVIAPYYYLFDWLLAILPGILFAFVGGLVVLGEIDDKIAGYMAVTPAGNTGHLISRLGIPSGISMMVSVFVIAVFGLSGMEWTDVILLSIGSSMLGIITALLVIALSTNKVEGMAIGKLAGLISIGMFVPIVFKTGNQYLAGVLPSFWIGKYMLEGRWEYLIIFAAVYSIWVYYLVRKYKKKVL